MKIGLIVPDNRDLFERFDEPAPIYGPAPQALIDGFAQLPECEVHVVSTVRKALACPREVAPNVHRHCLVVPRFRRMRDFHLGPIIALRAFFRRLQPDLVHGQGSERYPAIAAAYSGFPNVVTLHGVMTKIAEVEKAGRFSFTGATAVFERHALRRTRAVICLSNHAAEIVRKFNPNITVIPNAVGERFFQIERRPAPALEIICPALIYGLKNQLGLIEALEPLAARLDFKLTLMGTLTGDEASRKVERLVAARPWCQLAGMVGHKEVANALARATLLTLPSFEENCPMAILEGMAAGIPIAASRAGGIPDLVQDGVTGLLFDPHSPDSIRSAIERLLTNPDYAEKLANAGRERAMREFTTKAIAARHLNLYARLIAAVRSA